MNYKLLGIVAVLSAALLITAVGAWAGSAQRECPEKVVCPLTGELVCKDQCPLIDANRSDCPGKIVCPLDDELVCRDQCPLGTGEAISPCCQAE